MDDFSSFLQFSTELDDAERVLKADAVVESSGGFVGDCDSEKPHDSTLFWCSVECGSIGVGDELAVVESVGGCKASSLGVSELV